MGWIHSACIMTCSHCYTQLHKQLGSIKCISSCECHGQNATQLHGRLMGHFPLLVLQTEEHVLMNL